MGQGSTRLPQPRSQNIDRGLALDLKPAQKLVKRVREKKRGGRDGEGGYLRSERRFSGTVEWSRREACQGGSRGVCRSKHVANEEAKLCAADGESVAAYEKRVFIFCDHTSIEQNAVLNTTTGEKTADLPGTHVQLLISPLQATECV